VVFLFTLLSLAGLFLLLSAEFVGILQIIIYAGAILVLFLFVIMLLHAHSGEGPRVKLSFQPALAWVLSIALLIGIGAAFTGTMFAAPGPPPEGLGTAEAVGTTLFARFLLPFEITSVLLLVGAIGAVVLGRREEPGAPKPEEARAAEPKPEPEPQPSAGTKEVVQR
jgi:NADH-quinone oxidoreductase subunit J